MTRKDYIAIAAAIADQYSTYPCGIDQDIREAITAVAHNIADVLAADNDRFDSERFLVACGVLR